MAAYTKHPVSAPPAAPIREKTRHLLLRGWCTFVIFMAVAGIGWINAIGEIPSAILTIASGLLSVGLWFAVRPSVHWRRLPWVALAYVVWAMLSMLWSAWLQTSAITLLLLVITTVEALFVGSVLTWRELVRAIASALKWALALSLAFEIAVSVFVGGPLMQRFVIPTEKMDPIVYWSRDNLFAGGRIQGIWGNANLLGAIALVGLIVFAVRYAANAERRVLLIGWMVLAAYLAFRAASATTYLAAVAVAIVLATVLLMRTAVRPGQRTKFYAMYAAVGIIGGLVLWFGRDAIFTAFGRSADLTGRERIWGAVLERANERPVAGWGFATPWLPGDPAFDGWIVDHGQTVMQAHNMWVDVYLQLGVIGLVLMIGVYLAFIWRAWFFAVDRPRWDVRADRPYSPLTLLPTLLVTVLLVEGFAESGPLMLWGWMFVVMFAFKIKQSPHIGVGPVEQRLAIERGDQAPSEP